MDTNMEHIEYCLSVGKTMKARLYEIRTAKSMSLQYNTGIKERSIILNAELKEKVEMVLDDYYMSKLEDIRKELKTRVKKAANEFVYLTPEQNEIYDYVMKP